MSRRFHLQPLNRRILVLLTVPLIVACAASVEPSAPSPTPAAPTEMDLLCAEAVQEMRYLVELGAHTMTYNDPKGQLASLVETCVKEGRGDRPVKPQYPPDFNTTMDFYCDAAHHAFELMVEYEPDVVVDKLHSSFGAETGHALVNMISRSHDMCKDWDTHFSSLGRD